MSIPGNYSLTGSYMPTSAIPAGIGTNGYSTASFGSATPSDSFISSAYPTGTPAPSTMGALVQDMLTMMEMMMGVIANQLQSDQGSSSITGTSALNSGISATGNPVTASIYSYYNQDDPTLAHIDDPPPQPAPDDSGDE